MSPGFSISSTHEAFQLTKTEDSAWSLDGKNMLQENPADITAYVAEVLRHLMWVVDTGRR